MWVPPTPTPIGQWRPIYKHERRDYDNLVSLCLSFPFSFPSFPFPFPFSFFFFFWQGVSGITGGGGRVPPRDFWPGISCWPIGKKETRKKGEKGWKLWRKKENCKTQGGKLKMEGEKLENKERTFFFFFFCLSLSKTTKICFGSTKMEIFYREKAIHSEKKNQEKWLCPLRKIGKFSWYAPLPPPNPHLWSNANDLHDSSCSEAGWDPLVIGQLI